MNVAEGTAPMVEHRVSIRHLRAFSSVSQFQSFSQAAKESADSRVFAGIHFRSACDDGLAAGRKIGQRAVTLYLQPAKK